MHERFSQAFLQAVLERVDLENPAHRALLFTPSGDVADLSPLFDPIARGNRYHSACPLPEHRGDNDGRNFVYYRDRHYFKCFSSCGYVGSPFQLISRIRGVSFPAAVRLLAERVGLRPTGEFSLAAERAALEGQLARAGAVDRPVPARLPALPEGILPHFAGRLHPAMARYRLKPETWAAAGAGYCANLYQIVVGNASVWALRGPDRRWLDLAGKPLSLPAGDVRVKSFADRIVFAIRDAQGRLVGISGRSLRDAPGQPKYENNLGLVKSQVLYNLPFARRLLLLGAGAVFCVEGFADALRLSEWGLPAVAVMGASVSPQQAYLLRSLGFPVYLAFDGDEGGKAATLSAIRMLLQVGHDDIHVLPLPPGADPADLEREEFLRLKGQAVSVDEYLRRCAPPDAGARGAPRLSAAAASGRQKAGEGAPAPSAHPASPPAPDPARPAVGSASGGRESGVLPLPPAPSSGSRRTASTAAASSAPSAPAPPASSAAQGKPEEPCRKVPVLGQGPDCPPPPASAPPLAPAPAARQPAAPPGGAASAAACASSAPAPSRAGDGRELAPAAFRPAPASTFSSAAGDRAAAAGGPSPAAPPAGAARPGADRGSGLDVRTGVSVPPLEWFA